MPLKSTAGDHGALAKGRGASINPEGRFEVHQREAVEDGWFQEPPAECADKPKTVIAIEHAKSVISRHSSPDVGFSQSINPYRGCAHGCSYCAAGDTPILMGDGRTRALSELRIGDEIYGTVRQGAQRRYVRTRVLDHWSNIKPAFRTTLEDGTTLVTSADHRFLSDRGWKYVAGDTAGTGRRPFLTTHSQLMGTGAFAEGPRENGHYRRGYLCGVVRGDALLESYEYELGASVTEGGGRFRLAPVSPEAPWPAEASPDWSAGFLAGIFDTQGSCSQSGLRICSPDAEVLAWIERSLRAFGFSFVVEHVPHADREPMYVVRVTGGLREHLRFFHALRPAIARKLNLEGQALEDDAKLRVTSVEPLGKAMRLYDITTGSGDFIANGVVSHNCFARPSHAYLGLSPGIDFETRLTVKVNAAEKLREELAKPGYRCEPLTIGVNTDAYQPIEKEHRITRSILEVAHETSHPVALITKSALIERDLDLLVPMARMKLVSVTFSITTLDAGISRHMEPRTSAPARRLLAVRRLAEAGIPVNVNVAPVIPYLTDSELEPILEAAAASGARSAGYLLVRLPWEVKDIFRAWLEAHFPLKAAHVMSRIHQMREGRDNDPRFGTRMTGTGLFAQLLRQRFDKACKRLGLDRNDRDFELDCSRFRPPARAGQASLF